MHILFFRCDRLYYRRHTDTRKRNDHGCSINTLRPRRFIVTQEIEQCRNQNDICKHYSGDDYIRTGPASGFFWNGDPPV